MQSPPLPHRLRAEWPPRHRTPPMVHHRRRQWALHPGAGFTPPAQSEASDSGLAYIIDASSWGDIVNAVIDAFCRSSPEPAERHYGVV